MGTVFAWAFVVVALVVFAVGALALPWARQWHQDMAEDEAMSDAEWVALAEKEHAGRAAKRAARHRQRQEGAR